MNDELGMISNEGTGAIMNYELGIMNDELGMISNEETGAVMN